MKFIAILLSVFLITSGTAQHCIDERYGEEALFDTTQVDTLTNLTYGFSTHYFTNAEIELKMDVFMPAQDIDPLEQRPFILMIHGGGFAGGSRAEMNNECFGYAQRGFVAATISYRVGWNCDNVICFNCFGSNLQKAIYCAVQDARAAMRFAYDQKEEWGIDENWMFIGGESAGSITALLTSTWNQEEVNAWAPAGFENEVGSLDASGNDLPNLYSIKANVNHCGAVMNLAHLDNNLNHPIISFHDSNDCVVPYDYGSVIACFCSGFLSVAGSHQIHLKRMQQGECSELNTVPQVLPNHCQFPQNNLVELSSCFLKRVMCGFCMSFQNDDIYAQALCSNLSNTTSEVEGCTYPQSLNYNPEATHDDGSCEFSISCVGDLDADGVVGASDLILFIAAYGNICE
jgi:hypothetical protein